MVGILVIQKSLSYWYTITSTLCVCLSCSQGAEGILELSPDLTNKLFQAYNKCCFHERFRLLSSYMSGVMCVGAFASWCFWCHASVFRACLLILGSGHRFFSLLLMCLRWFLYKWGSFHAILPVMWQLGKLACYPFVGPCHSQRPGQSLAQWCQVACRAGWGDRKFC